jgi:hypothetical protein
MPHLRLALLSLLAGFVLPPAASAAAPEGPRLAFPLACAIGRTCEVQNNVDHDPGPAWKDYRCGSHTYDKHTGVDIRLLDMAAQRAGVNVLAADAGKVIRLRDGVADAILRGPVTPAVAAQGCGNAVVVDNGGGWVTSYCHLARGSVKVKIGDSLAAGQPIAQVGLSGETAFPHLHLEVRHDGAVVDPFAPAQATGACDAQAAPADGLWTHGAAEALAYKRGAVLNAGFAGAQVTPDGVEEASLAPAAPAAPVLIAYVRAINLEKGDVQEIVLRGPAGTVLKQYRLPALEGPKAQYLMTAGSLRPAEGWRPGTYSATYSVTRAGGVALTRVFTTRL